MLNPTPPKKSRRVVKERNAQKQHHANAWLSWFVPLTIFLITILAFLPALNNGFVGWDDDGNIDDNPHYRGLGWTQLRWMFTTFDMSLYRPLTWATLGEDYVVWGMNPFGYHLTSVLLHAGSCVLFYFIARDLLVLARSDANPPDDIPVLIGAAFAALIFAIHPLRVEPVAWVSARNDVVSGLFYLASMLCYLRAARLGSNQATRWYWLAAAVIVFGLSLLSKAMGVTLPAVLLVLDIYPLKRLVGGPDKWFGAKVRHIWWEKVPFLLLAFGFGVIALLAKYSTGALRPMQQYFLSYRIGQAFYGLCFYLLKTFVPVNLSPLYELPYDFDTWMPLFVLCGAVVVLITVAVFLSRKRYPALLACWVYYLIVVTPVLGVAQSGPQIVADRYSYLACLSWAILA